ncbi:MAG: saccharopine dehydrogenase NADP-binding domain-containing protein [Planctomycetes bacterium]|nr:saccharopine dehydrogenase NADP-binding domain-containing protein [Planctomycetota bacterium]
MKKVLLLGAGLVARPLVRYLLERAGVQVTIATRTAAKAEALAAGHPHAAFTTLLADDQATLSRLVAEHDLAVSLLPAPLHPAVAQACIRHRKHMVTTSYVSPTMRALDAAAKDAGVLLLNEIGVDPGIDHMSAMRVIDQVRGRGGTVTHFKSYCGGLPAPDANNNPWGYKFSWSPRAVCTAGKNSAHYLLEGRNVEIPAKDLFTDNRHGMRVDGVGDLEAYPNRDSLSYIDTYNLRGIKTMFRGTFRYPGWCATLKAVVDLGLLDETPTTYPAGTTYAQFTRRFIGGKPAGSLRRDVAAFLKLDERANPLHRLEWLGLFSDEPLAPAGQPTTPLDVLATRMERKMKYAPGERDMIVMCHSFVAEYPARPAEYITSTLVDFGIPNGDTSMARTVSLPAAVAVRMILEGRLPKTGVQIPVTPDIYKPVLDEMESMGIAMREATAPHAGR